MVLNKWRLRWKGVWHPTSKATLAERLAEFANGVTKEPECIEVDREPLQVTPVPSVRCHSACQPSRSAQCVMQAGATIQVRPRVEGSRWNRGIATLREHCNAQTPAPEPLEIVRYAHLPASHGAHVCRHPCIALQGLEHGAYLSYQRHGRGAPSISLAWSTDSASAIPIVWQRRADPDDALERAVECIEREVRKKQVSSLSLSLGGSRLARSQSAPCGARRSWSRRGCVP